MCYTNTTDVFVNHNSSLDDSGNLRYIINRIMIMHESDTTSGWGVLSAQGNRKGYAGYEHDENISELTHVRNRVLHTTLGRWTRRDPLGYVDGMSLYEYVGSMLLVRKDSFGLKKDDDWWTLDCLKHTCLYNSRAKIIKSTLRFRWDEEGGLYGGSDMEPCFDKLVIKLSLWAIIYCLPDVDVLTCIRPCSICLWPQTAYKACILEFNGLKIEVPDKCIIQAFGKITIGFVYEYEKGTCGIIY